MSGGAEGILAASGAPTLRQALARLTADLASARPGLVPEVAREWLASSFDLTIEVARLRDGRHRVVRVAELTAEGSIIGTKDIFTFSIERTAAGGAVEGSFHSTGTVPAFVNELAGRGTAVDMSIFRRASSR
jgi:pilus assembly protein CpaF